MSRESFTYLEYDALSLKASYYRETSNSNQFKFNFYEDTRDFAIKNNLKIENTLIY